MGTDKLIHLKRHVLLFERSADVDRVVCHYDLEHSSFNDFGEQPYATTSCAIRPAALQRPTSLLKTSLDEQFTGFLNVEVSR